MEIFVLNLAIYVHFSSTLPLLFKFVINPVVFTTSALHFIAPLQFVHPGPSIFLVVYGSCDLSCNHVREELCEGTALFVSASTELKLYPKLSVDMLVFQAYCSL